MDSRADTLYTTTILQGYLTMYAARPGWQTALKSNGVQTVLVERTAPLAQMLAREPGWRLAYRDRLAVVYTHG